MTSIVNAATSLAATRLSSATGDATSAASSAASGATGAASTATSGAGSVVTKVVSHAHHGLSGGKIAGIVVGSVIGGLLIIGLLLLGCFCLLRKKRKAKKEQKYVTEKTTSIDSSPSSAATADVERGRVNGVTTTAPAHGLTTTAPATKAKAPNPHDASAYVSRTHNEKIDDAAMQNIITPAHVAGIRTADDVSGIRGNVMTHTMQTAQHIGDYPVSDVSRGKTVETAGECRHYGVANP